MMPLFVCIALLDLNQFESLFVHILFTGIDTFIGQL